MGYPYEEGLVIRRLLTFCTLSSVPGLLSVILLSAVNDPPLMCCEGLMLRPNVGQPGPRKPADIMLIPPCSNRLSMTY